MLGCTTNDSRERQYLSTPIGNEGPSLCYHEILETAQSPKSFSLLGFGAGTLDQDQSISHLSSSSFQPSHIISTFVLLYYNLEEYLYVSGANVQSYLIRKRNSKVKLKKAQSRLQKISGVRYYGCQCGSHVSLKPHFLFSHSIYKVYTKVFYLLHLNYELMQNEGIPAGWKIMENRLFFYPIHFHITNRMV